MTDQATRDQALASFLRAASADPSLGTELRQAASEAASALESEGQGSRSPREQLADVQRELNRLRRVVGDLYGTMEQEEWPSGA